MGPDDSSAGIKEKRGKDNSASKEGVIVVERRKHPRLFVELPLDYSQVDRQEVHRGIATNASEGGLLVYLPETIEIGVLLKIEILFAKSPDVSPELTTIRGIARVIWSDLAAQESWGEYRYGLQLHSFQKGDLEKLKGLLRAVGKVHGA